MVSGGRDWFYPPCWSLQGCFGSLRRSRFSHVPCDEISSVPRSGPQAIENRFPFAMGYNRAENKLSEEQGHNHRMKLLPLLPGFPSSKCCVLCVCVHACSPRWLSSLLAYFSQVWQGMEVQRHSVPTR